MKSVEKGLPPRYVTKYRWDEVAERVRSEPGEWLLLPELKEVPHSVASAIQRNNIKALPRDEFEVATRNNHHLSGVKNGRRCDVYLMYKGH